MSVGDDGGEVTTPHPKVILVRLAGPHLTAEHGERLARVVENRLARLGAGTFIAFDAFNLETYDNAARTALLMMFAKHLRLFERLIVGTNSMVVRMGAATANIPLGGKIHVRTQSEEFERELAELCSTAA